jgi:hypothetical protein
MKKIITTSLLALMVSVPAMADQYTVKSGDTVKGIADLKGMTLAQLSDLNPQIKNINLIYPNQKINLGDGEYVNEESKPVAEEVKAEPVAETIKTVIADEVASKSKCAACDNVINGNPMYRPVGGHFYSVTSLETHGFGGNSDIDYKGYNLNEVLGYGITDRLSIFIDTNASTTDSFKDGTFAWNNFGGGISYRALNEGNWKGDVYGKMRSSMVQEASVGTAMAIVLGGGSLDNDFWHEDTNAYTWTAGTKFGYSSCIWTLNGLFEYDYANSEAFNWDVEGLKGYRAGIEGQFVLNEDWNLIGRATYEMPEIFANYFTGKLGVNYNITTDMYVGVYAFQTMNEDADNFGDQTGLGLQFGIDF